MTPVHDWTDRAVAINLQSHIQQLPPTLVNYYFSFHRKHRLLRFTFTALNSFRKHFFVGNHKRTSKFQGHVYQACSIIPSQATATLCWSLNTILQSICYIIAVIAETLSGCYSCFMFNRSTQRDSSTREQSFGNVCGSWNVLTDCEGTGEGFTLRRFSERNSPKES